MPDFDYADPQSDFADFTDFADQDNQWDHIRATAVPYYHAVDGDHIKDLERYVYTTNDLIPMAEDIRRHTASDCWDNFRAYELSARYLSH